MTVPDYPQALARAFYGHDEPLFPLGPSNVLISVGDVQSNPWFVEPALRTPYNHAAAGKPPAHASAKDAALVASAPVSATADPWPDGVFTDAPDAPLSVDPYRLHVAILLTAANTDAAKFAAYRASLTRVGYQQTTDPMYSTDRKEPAA